MSTLVQISTTVLLFMSLTPPKSTLFPYTTLFRSENRADGIANSEQGEGHVRKSLQLLSRKAARSEEHTSELSHQITSYAVFCLKKKSLKREVSTSLRFE